MVILFPVVCPVLFVYTDNGSFIFDSFRIKAGFYEFNTFKSVLFLLDVNVDKGMGAVALKKFLLNKVNMGNVPDNVFKIAVIFNINTHIRNNGANVACSCGIFGFNFYGKLVPGFHFNLP